MQRYAMFGAAIAAMAMTDVGAMWMRAALANAFTDGRKVGVSEIQTANGLESDRRPALSEAALARSNQEAAALEIECDRPQEKLDDFVQKVERAAHAGDYCLDPDLVRALAEIGRNPAGPGAHAR